MEHAVDGRPEVTAGGRARASTAPAAPAARFRLRGPAAVVLGAFALTRLVAYAAGVRFDGSFLAIAWQLLDPAWLRDDLAGSVWYLHSQPPLYNLVVGAVSAVAPGREVGVMHAVHLVLGVLLAVAMLDLLRRLGVSAVVATGATLLFVASPAALIYEQWLFYSYPIAAALLFAAWALFRFARRPTPATGLAAFALAAVAALTWSLFHVVWLLAVAAAVATVGRLGFRRTALAALIPLVVVLGWYGKNLVVFGDFTASSWLGMSLFRVTTAEIDADELDAMVADGRLPPVAGIRTFSPLEDYADVLALPGPTGHVVLDAERKTDGTDNFNHLGYRTVSDAYQEAAVEVARLRPQAYAAAVAKGACRFVLPSTDYWFLQDNRARIAWADRAYNAVVYGQLRTPPMESGCNLRNAPAQFPFVFPLLFAAAVLTAVAAALRRRESAPVRATMAFVAVTLVWVAVAGNMFEFGENNRFRFVTEPLMWVALGVLVDRLLARRRVTRHAGTEPGSAAADGRDELVEP